MRVAWGKITGDDGAGSTAVPGRGDRQGTKENLGRRFFGTNLRYQLSRCTREQERQDRWGTGAERISDPPCSVLIVR